MFLTTHWLAVGTASSVQFPGFTTVAGFTVTVTGADVVTAPALSVALAVSVYVPAATLVHVNAYGAVVFVEPVNRDEPLKNSTLETVPSESAAFAESVMDAGAVYVALFDGAVNETVGATFAGGVTVVTETVTGADVVTAPALSVAFAVSVYVPAATFVHENVYGAEASEDTNVEPLKNSTLATVPSESAAFAESVMDAGAVYVALFDGAVNETVGATFVGGVTVVTETVTGADVVTAPVLSVQ